MEMTCWLVQHMGLTTTDSDNRIRHCDSVVNLDQWDETSNGVNITDGLR